MHTSLNKLTLLNFKNYADAALTFCPKINCFTGNNGTGKTNILDAIYYLSLCKSCFTTTDTQNIKHNEDFFTIQGEYAKNEKTENVYCGLKQGSKKIFKRNGKEYDRLSDHIGFLPLVMISPSDSSLILEGSEERRKFIDAVLSQFDHQYLDDILRYNRALLQRNLLLKDFDQKRWFDPDMLEMWDEQMVDTGTRIFVKRKEFIEGMIPVFQNFYEFITEGKEKVNLSYESQLFDTELSSLLAVSQDKDRRVLYTTCGIHKDDIVLKLGDYPIKRIGSQGQQKTFLVSLKLAQFEYIRKQSKEFPILLLDDIFDKFDEKRVNKIIELVSRADFGQIFITDTSSERMHEILQQINGSHLLFLLDGEDITVTQINTN
ncbi:MAG TPA: DNA replication/repair protein RecF [Bacteroidales bacterium]|nr:DNA replication/repair protein RecF [Bacteroidales bacterium]